MNKSTSLPIYISDADMASTGLKIGDEFTLSQSGHTYKSMNGMNQVFKATNVKQSIGRPPLPPILKTKPYTVWLTDAERSKVKQQERGWLRNLIRKAKP